MVGMGVVGIGMVGMARPHMAMAGTERSHMETPGMVGMAGMMMAGMGTAGMESPGMVMLDTETRKILKAQCVERPNARSCSATCSQSPRRWAKARCTLVTGTAAMGS